MKIANRIITILLAFSLVADPVTAAGLGRCSFKQHPDFANQSCFMYQAIVPSLWRFLHPLINLWDRRRPVEFLWTETPTGSLYFQGLRFRQPIGPPRPMMMEGDSPDYGEEFLRSISESGPAGDGQDTLTLRLQKIDADLTEAEGELLIGHVKEAWDKARRILAINRHDFVHRSHKISSNPSLRQMEESEKLYVRAKQLTRDCEWLQQQWTPLVNRLIDLPISRPIALAHELDQTYRKLENPNQCRGAIQILTTRSLKFLQEADTDINTAPQKTVHLRDAGFHVLDVIYAFAITPKQSRGEPFRITSKTIFDLVPRQFRRPESETHEAYLKNVARERHLIRFSHFLAHEISSVFQLKSMSSQIDHLAYGWFLDMLITFFPTAHQSLAIWIISRLYSNEDQKVFLLRDVESHYAGLMESAPENAQHAADAESLIRWLRRELNHVPLIVEKDPYAVIKIAEMAPSFSLRYNRPFAVRIGGSARWIFWRGPAGRWQMQDPDGYRHDLPPTPIGSPFRVGSEHGPAIHLELLPNSILRVAADPGVSDAVLILSPPFIDDDLDGKSVNSLKRTLTSSQLKDFRQRNNTDSLKLHMTGRGGVRGIYETDAYVDSTVFRDGDHLVTLRWVQDPSTKKWRIEPVSLEWPIWRDDGVMKYEPMPVVPDPGWMRRDLGEAIREVNADRGKTDTSPNPPGFRFSQLGMKGPLPEKSNKKDIQLLKDLHKHGLRWLKDNLDNTDPKDLERVIPMAQQQILRNLTDLLDSARSQDLLEYHDFPEGYKDRLFAAYKYTDGKMRIVINPLGQDQLRRMLMDPGAHFLLAKELIHELTEILLENPVDDPDENGWSDGNRWSMGVDKDEPWVEGFILNLESTLVRLRLFNRITPSVDDERRAELVNGDLETLGNMIGRYYNTNESWESRYLQSMNESIQAPADDPWTRWWSPLLQQKRDYASVDFDALSTDVPRHWQWAQDTLLMEPEDLRARLRSTPQSEPGIRYSPSRRRESQPAAKAIAVIMANLVKNPPENSLIEIDQRVLNHRRVMVVVRCYLDEKGRPVPLGYFTLGYDANEEPWAMRSVRKSYKQRAVTYPPAVGKFMGRLDEQLERAGINWAHRAFHEESFVQANSYMAAWDYGRITGRSPIGKFGQILKNYPQLTRIELQRALNDMHFQRTSNLGLHYVLWKQAREAGLELAPVFRTLCDQFSPLQAFIHLLNLPNLPEGLQHPGNLEGTLLSLDMRGVQYYTALYALYFKIKGDLIEQYWKLRQDLPRVFVFHKLLQWRALPQHLRKPVFLEKLLNSLGLDEARYLASEYELLREAQRAKINLLALYRSEQNSITRLRKALSKRLPPDSPLGHAKAWTLEKLVSQLAAFGTVRSRISRHRSDSASA